MEVACPAPARAEPSSDFADDKRILDEVVRSTSTFHEQVVNEFVGQFTGALRAALMGMSQATLARTYGLHALFKFRLAAGGAQSASKLASLMMAQVTTPEHRRVLTALTEKFPQWAQSCLESGGGAEDMPPSCKRPRLLSSADGEVSTDEEVTAPKAGGSSGDSTPARRGGAETNNRVSSARRPVRNGQLGQNPGPILETLRFELLRRQGTRQNKGEKDTDWAPLLSKICDLLCKRDVKSDRTEFWKAIWLELRTGDSSMHPDPSEDVQRFLDAVSANAEAVKRILMSKAGDA